MCLEKSNVGDFGKTVQTYLTQFITDKQKQNNGTTWWILSLVANLQKMPPFGVPVLGFTHDAQQHCYRSWENVNSAKSHWKPFTLNRDALIFPSVSANIQSYWHLLMYLCLSGVSYYALACSLGTGSWHLCISLYGLHKKKKKKTLPIE